MNLSIEHLQLHREGCSIHYFAAGDKGKELIILLHPAFADHGCFETQLEAFTAGYRVIAPDLLGHGLSQPHASKESIDATVEHLHAIMEAEGAAICHLLGVSLGGLLAQYFAFLFPERVRSLTIVGSYCIHERNKEVGRSQGLEMFKWIGLAMISMPRLRKYLASVSVSTPAGQQRFYEMAGRFTRASFRVMSGMRTIVRARKDAAWGKPLLLIHGEHDLDLVRRLTANWHRQAEGSRLLVIPDAGHCANMDQPQAFNEAVLGFLRSLPQ